MLKRKDQMDSLPDQKGCLLTRQPFVCLVPVLAVVLI